MRKHHFGSEEESGFGVKRQWEWCGIQGHFLYSSLLTI